MQAFDEEWESSLPSSLPTEFSMRPELTPTKADAQQKNTLTFEKPDLEGTPSMPRKDDGHQVTADPSGAVKRSASGRKIPARVMSVLKKSIISFVLFFLIMSCLLVLIIESDSQMFAHLRKLPEMDLFRRDYYEPLKETISQTIRR